MIRLVVFASGCLFEIAAPVCQGNTCFQTPLIYHVSAAHVARRQIKGNQVSADCEVFTEVMLVSSG